MDLNVERFTKIELIIQDVYYREIYEEKKKPSVQTAQHAPDQENISLQMCKIKTTKD